MSLLKKLSPNLSLASLGEAAAVLGAQKLIGFLVPDTNLAKLGEFPFSIKNGPGLESLIRRVRYQYAKHEPAGGFPAYQAVGQWDEEVELKGYFLLRKLSAMWDIYNMAEAKEPLALTMGHGEFMGRYVILELEETRTEWLKAGEHLRLDFTMKLGAVN